MFFNSKEIETIIAYIADTEFGFMGGIIKRKAIINTYVYIVIISHVVIMYMGVELYYILHNIGWSHVVFS